MIGITGRRSNFVFLAAVFGSLLSLTVSSSALAQQAKVIKVQGRKAIVQFPEDARPHVGQAIDLSGGAVSISGESHSGGASGPRAMIIGGSAELSSLTPSGSSNSYTRMSFDGRYGWNTGIMEYGAIGTFSYSSTTGSSSRKIEAGGFFDYNLVPNVTGTEMVYGGMATAKVGQLGFTAGSAEQTGTLMTLEVGGQLKWFPLGNNVAVRGDVLYRIENVADNVKSMATGPGLVAKAGFYIYF